MKLRILGSGGWIPTRERNTCSYILKSNREILLIDAGSGLSNFSLYQEWLVDTDTIHIVLSHYHLDHVLGLIYLLNISRKHKLRILGPGQPYYMEGCEQILKNLIHPPYFSRPIGEFSDDVLFFDYHEGENSVSNEFYVRVFEQPHSDPSMGLLINNTFYYATDTILSENTFRQAVQANAKMLFHECWTLQKRENQMHTSLNDLLALAESYPTLKVGLIHLNPNWDESIFSYAEEKTTQTNCFLLKDGQEFEF